MRKKLIENSERVPTRADSRPNAAPSFDYESIDIESLPLPSNGVPVAVAPTRPSYGRRLGERIRARRARTRR